MGSKGATEHCKGESWWGALEQGCIPQDLMNFVKCIWFYFKRLDWITMEGDHGQCQSSLQSLKHESSLCITSKGEILVD